MAKRRRWKSLASVATAALTVAALATRTANAGPPFVTDDPEPTDPGRWEIYNFVSGRHIAGQTAGQAGFDINYGGAKDLQLTTVVPLDYSRTTRTDASLGGIELAAKYRFLHQRRSTLLPDVAFFPRLITPTAGARFGTGKLNVFLPLWAQKDVGPWSLFGGGYMINPGLRQRDFWLNGIGVSRSIGKQLSIGAEAYHQTRDADDSWSSTGFNLGALYRLSRHWSLIGSAGAAIENARDKDGYSCYFALKADY